jgi:hypothetical protein
MPNHSVGDLLHTQEDLGAVPRANRTSPATPPKTRIPPDEVDSVIPEVLTAASHCGADSPIRDP